MIQRVHRHMETNLLIGVMESWNDQYATLLRKSVACLSGETLESAINEQIDVMETSDDVSEILFANACIVGLASAAIAHLRERAGGDPGGGGD